MSRFTGRSGSVPSLPTRGGWIEILVTLSRLELYSCPSPHGEGGLKLRWDEHVSPDKSPSPHGEGGLKWGW